MRKVLISKLNKARPRERSHQCWLDRVKGDLNQVNETARIKDADNRYLCRILLFKAEGFFKIYFYDI